MNPVFAILFWAFLQSPVVEGPEYPPNVVAGGNVVCVLHLAAGFVSGIDILTGDAPFVEPVQAALLAWNLGRSAHGDVLVVVNYRTPTLFPSGRAVREIPQAKANPGLAYPKSLVEPSYPPNSLAEGSVVLKLALTASGSIAKISVVRGLAGMTEACVAAAGQWTFLPARASASASIPSEAYAVFVICRPILAPIKK